MQQTSDTEFYSLSLNSLAPPPYSLPNSTIPSRSDIESGSEKHDAFPTAFVRLFTPPFLRNNSIAVDANATHETTTVWSRTWHNLIDLTVNWWLWELFSWFISALCTFGIALLLGYYDGKAVPDQWPLGITLNAYIAVLSGIAKYTLAVPVDEVIGQVKWHWFAQQPRPLMDFERFDDASRGPWGAFTLLLRTKGRFASLGAIVTILSLAMDPFFQQLVDLPKRPSALGQSAVPRMVNFELQRNTYQNSTTGQDAVAPDRLMQDVVFSFMVNNGTVRELSAFCPSQDCAWKPFDTLAMCSSCTDISSLLTLACLEEPGDWRKNVSVNDADVPKVFSCGYFLNATSDNPVLMSGYAMNTSSTPAEPLEFLLMRNLNLQDVNVDKTYWGGSMNYVQDGFPLVDFLQVASEDSNAILRGKPPVARECVLRWCTERIVASYDEGTYKEEVMFESFQADPAFDALEFGADMFFEYKKNISIKPPNSNLTFYVPDDTTLSTIFLFQDFFPSYLTAANTSAIPMLRTRNVVESPPRHWLYPTNPFASKDGAVDYIANMTKAVTNVIRAYPGTSELFRGSGSVETYIKVRWGFFALPLTLVCMTLALLVAVILDHRKHKECGIMKSSVLASMLNGMSDNVRNSFSSTTRLSAIFEHSSRIEVSLRQASGRTYLEMTNETNV